MKEHPIPFSSEMIPPVMSGSKTQTRRLNMRWLKAKPGDRLWVRETWRLVFDPMGCVVGYRDNGYVQRFGTDGPDGDWHHSRWWDDSDRLIEAGYSGNAFGDWLRPDGRVAALDDLWGRWRSPRFMPRWASRTLLEILSVREEILQEISQTDAMSEGVVAPGTEYTETPRELFALLWDRINGNSPGKAWADNPAVVVIEFRRIGQ